MAKKSLGVTSALKLEGAQVCTQQGTTTELNLADFFRRNNMKYTPVTFATNDETRTAYEAGRCDVFTTDVSGLYAERLKLTKPDGPHRAAGGHLQGAAGLLVRANGDMQWANIVKWTHYAMLNAEELGCDARANLAQSLQSANRRSAACWASRASSARASASPTTGPPASSAMSATTARPSSAMSAWARSSRSPAASTLCGRTAACSTPRRSADNRAQWKGVRRTRALFCAGLAGRSVARAAQLRQHDMKPMRPCAARRARPGE